MIELLLTILTILFNIAIDLGKLIISMYIGMAFILALFGYNCDEIAYVLEEATKVVYDLITRKKDSD